jgi:hypothetical protein
MFEELYKHFVSGQWNEFGTSLFRDYTHTTFYNGMFLPNKLKKKQQNPFLRQNQLDW